mmetsp:Transcript_5530/g.14118  ORF Transcript_5530/g.14118 Transcript_5530/m.14118 type:complete len:253 (+) Transcript_5530:439-1197(+)
MHWHALRHVDCIVAMHQRVRERHGKVAYAPCVHEIAKVDHAHRLVLQAWLLIEVGQIACRRGRDEVDAELSGGGYCNGNGRDTRRRGALTLPTRQQRAGAIPDACGAGRWRGPHEYVAVVEVAVVELPWQAPSEWRDDASEAVEGLVDQAALLSVMHHSQQRWHALREASQVPKPRLGIGARAHCGRICHRKRSHHTTDHAPCVECEAVAGAHNTQHVRTLKRQEAHSMTTACALCTDRGRQRRVLDKSATH